MNLWNRLGRKKHISDLRGCAALIFSSDQAFLNYYRDLIVSLGLTPISTATPEGAQGMLRMTRAALVVVDQARGASACSRVLECVRKFQKHAAVLVISPNANSFFRQEALALGAADYLEHPALQDDVIHALIPSHPRGPQSLEQSA